MDIDQLVEKSNIVPLKNFIKEHKLTKKDLLRNRDVIEKYVAIFFQCEESLATECQQLISGYQLELVYENERIYLKMRDCAHQRRLRAVNRFKNNYLICHLPEAMMNLSLAKDFKVLKNDQTRFKLKEYFSEFIQKKQTKGIYIHGAPGIGKTYLSILLANELVRANYKVCFVFVPQLMAELKQAIAKTGNFLGNQIKKLQTCDILFLDDLAGESVSEWTRDEILFSILNHRMQHDLATFFTSNYDLGNLQDYYSRNLKYKNIDMVRSIRLVERIRYLAKPVLLTSKPLRKYAY